LRPNPALKIERAIPADVAPKPGFILPPFCHPECHEFEPASDEEWSYNGLHILENGDRLTVFNKNNPAKILWRGEIKLIPHKPFKKNAFGFWIHADQLGFEGRRRKKWARWFMENYPAKLIPHK
jgi:hypothetical protein